MLATIVSQDPIYAEFPMSLRQVSDIAAEHHQDLAVPFNIDAYLTRSNGTPYDQGGKLNFVANQVDQQTDTLLVRAVFPNPHRELVDGAFVTVRIEEAAEQKRLVIPRATLLLDQIGVYVLTVDEDQKVEPQRVQTGAAINTDIAITSGLEAGRPRYHRRHAEGAPGQTVQATVVASMGGAAK